MSTPPLDGFTQALTNALNSTRRPGRDTTPSPKLRWVYVALSLTVVAIILLAVIL